MNSSVVFFIFFVALVLNLLISYLGSILIPYLGFFPYKEILLDYHLPKFLSSFANFDGVHYILIAKQGYTQYEQAFFPLYPLLIKFISPLFLNNQFLAGFIISNIAFLLGLFIFSKYLKLIFKNNQQSNNLTISAILFLLLFPTSFFFNAVYTEGFFFFLMIGSLYFLKKKNYILTSVFAFLASLTRLVGVFLIIPIVLNILKNKRGRIYIRPYNIFKFLITIFSPLLGLFIYCFYLWKTTGDPFFFLHSQWAFGAHRSSNLIFLPQVYFRYFKIFFTADFDFQYFISLFEFFTFNFVLIILIVNLFKILTPPKAGKNYELLSLNIFSLINLIIPTLTGTLSSIPRYILFSLSFFIALAQIKNNFAKILIGLAFIILHIIILGFFSQGYFVG